MSGSCLERSSRSLLSPAPPPCPGPFYLFPGVTSGRLLHQCPQVAGTAPQTGLMCHLGLVSHAVGWMGSQVQAGRFLLRPLSVCGRCLILCPHVAVPLCPDLLRTQVIWDQGPA